MSKLTDERLDELLEGYHQIEPPQVPVFSPAGRPKRSVIPFPRRYIAAASVVMITLLGVTVYFLFGNKNAVPVKSVEPTSNTETAADHGISAPDPTDPTNADRKEKTSIVPTQVATEIATDSMGREYIVTTYTTVRPTDAPSPAAPTQPAGKKPQPSPTQKPTEKPQTQPTHKPSVKPTEAQKPTAAPATEKPTQPYVPDIRTVEVILPIREGITVSEDNDGTMYCCVYDSDGNPLGDSDLYSRSHRLDVHSTGEIGYQSDVPCYYYAVGYDANQVPAGRFTYRIYLRDGTELEQGTVFG